MDINVAEATAAAHRNKDTKASKVNPILAVLGTPQFVLGNGKQYPRTEGFGANRKPHPGGGTNETAAFVVFTPFVGLPAVSLEGRIYLERFVENGKNVRRYNVALSCLQTGKRDAMAAQAVEAVKIEVGELYRTWIKSAPTATTPSVKSGGVDWTETDEA